MRYYPHIWGDYVFPPGQTVVEILEHCGVPKESLEQRMGWSPQFVADLIVGEEEITKDMPIALEEVTGVSSRFWLTLQRNYHKEVARLKRSGKYRPPEDVPERVIVDNSQTHKQ